MLTHTLTLNPMHWVGRQVLNRAKPADYFDPLLEFLNPAWARRYIPARVVSLTPETHDTTTLTLRPARRWGDFLAGQHLNLEVVVNGRWFSRPFSLSSAPSQWHEQGTISVTVKTVPDGVVTPFLNQKLAVGDCIGVSPAYGGEPLPAESMPSLFIAGGSGITPVLSQLQALADQHHRAPITVLYFVRTSADVIGAFSLEAIKARMPNLDLHVVASEADPANPVFLNGDHLEAVPDLTQRHCFVCGPPGLMDKAHELLDAAGVPAEQVHSTLFAVGPRGVVSEGAGGTVRFERSDLTAESDGSLRLLEQAEQAGLRPHYGCRMGICHQCSCRKTSGVVINQQTGVASGHGEELIQLCVSVPQGLVSLQL